MAYRGRVGLHESHELGTLTVSGRRGRGAGTEWEVSLGWFALGVTHLLERLRSRAVGGSWSPRWPPARTATWQGTAFEDGSLVAEAGSGTALLPSECLSPRRSTLVEHRAGPPEFPSTPNWQRVEATTSPDVTAAADQAVRTPRDVYGTEPPIDWCCTVPSPRRGGTPASEQVPDDLMTLDEPAPRRGFRPTDEAWADDHRRCSPTMGPWFRFPGWKTPRQRSTWL